jgi:hypothetical protein
MLFFLSMRKVIFSIALVVALFAAKPVMAQESNCVQVPLYGGGVGTVCGAKTHETVDTAFEGITPGVLGGAFLGVSGIFAYLSKKARKLQ